MVGGMKRQFFCGLGVCLGLAGGLRAAEIRVPGQYATIQSAIDAASEGDTILVGPGTYRERIVLKPRLLVRSVGDETEGETGLKRAEATVLDGGGAEADSPGVTMAEGAILDGFTVTNTGAYDETKWQKSWDNQGSDQAHDHIGNFGNPGIAAAGVSCQILNNVVHHNGDTGIAIRGVDGRGCTPVVANNVCYRNMGGGIGSMHGSTAVIRDNVCFENYFAGIGHDNAGPLVIGNECYRNVRAGIGISEGASPVVRGNRCYGNRRAGIGIRTGSETRPLVEDNDCFENAMAGIGSEEEAAPVIRNNRCYRNQLAGIGSRDHATPLVIDNQCHENHAAGIGLAGADALLVGNKLERNKSAGIGISGKSQAVVVRNTCRENRLVAVGIPGESQALLYGNTLERKEGMPPIVAILNGSEAIMVENTVAGGGVAGILLQGKLMAMRNTLSGSGGGSGISVADGAEAVLAENGIQGYREEVRNQGSVISPEK